MLEALLIYLFIGIVFEIVMILISTVLGVKYSATGMMCCLVNAIVWPLAIILTVRLIILAFRGESDELSREMEYLYDYCTIEDEGP